MSTGDKVRNIGCRLELFVDDWLIEGLEGVRLQLHRPARQEIALQIDQPWEQLWREESEAQRKEAVQKGTWGGPTPFGFASVMKDGDLYRMYYSWDRGHTDSLTGYAESRDGIRWEKPRLGIVNFQDSSANNLIWAKGRLYDFSPFADTNPTVRAEEKYKTIAGGPPVGLVSPDGLHWKMLREAPLLTDGAFDSQNIVFWDTERKEYVAFYRDFVRLPNQRKIRAIKRSSSSNFTEWTRGEWLDYGSAPLEHFYTNAIIPYFRAPHIYLAFPTRFIPDRKAVPEHPYEGVSDAVFMTSRDGLNWDRRFLEAFIRPGPEKENWTERNFLVAWGVVPTGPAELSIYWVEHFRHPGNKIRRGALRLDGFVSLHAEYPDGEIITCPLTFQGSRLLLNYSTSAAGSIRVDLLEASGEPITGLSDSCSPELFGDSIAADYRWNSSAKLEEWAGRPVRLRIRLRDADLYSLQFARPLPRAQSPERQ